jgi:large subunit ribosomal protein L17
MYRNMVTSLLQHERIQTTDAKAKEVRRVAERMITLGKRGGLPARRRALRVIRSRDVAAKVFDDLAERYRDRAGGYTRVLKLGARRGDAASVSLVELVDAAPTRDEKPARKKKGRTAAKQAPAKKAEAEKRARSAGKKARAKKAVSKKAGGDKAAAKKTSGKKASGKKTTSKKTTSKKTTRKKKTGK